MVGSSTQVAQSQERPAAAAPESGILGVYRRLSLVAVVGLSTAAGGVHLALADHHFEQWWVYGTFFVAVAGAQLLFAMLFLLPATRAGFAVAGILGNLVVLATYVMSRTTGVPIGWHAWTPEPIGWVDLGTAVGELALIGFLLSFVRPRLRPWLVNLLCGCGLAAFALRAAGYLT